MKKLLWLFKHTQKKGVLLFAICLSIMAAFLRQGVTYYLGNAVDAATNKNLQLTLSILGFLVFGIFILLAIDFFSMYLYGNATSENMYYFRSKTVQSAIQFTLKERAKYSTGELINRLNSDMNILENFFGTILKDTIYKVFVGLFATIFGFLINYKVMLVLLTLCLITAVVNYFFAKPVEKLQGQLQEASDRIMLAFQEAIHGNKEIKAYAIEDTLINKFARLVKNHAQNMFSMARIEALWGAIEITVSIALQIGIVFLCLFFVLREEMTLGNVVVFQQIVEMVKGIFVIDFVSINKTLAIIARISDLWKSGSSTQHISEVSQGNPGEPLLEFSHVSFNFDSNSTGRAILNDLSFRVAENESIAIVGPSGGGKSTIVNLICGLLKPDTGQIRFQGYEMHKWDEQTLYDRISLVDQESVIFPVSVYENIAAGAYGSRCVEQDQIKTLVTAAIEDASLTSWLDTLPQREMTDVGEFGSKLSGGQRQRISIARALVKSPTLIILDEPTSSVDAQTERDIVSSLHKRVSGRMTMITVAHRLSTVKNADKILVLNGGRIEEQGSHEYLMAQKGLYYRMFTQQNRARLEETDD